MKKLQNLDKPQDLEKYNQEVPENDEKLLQVNDFIKKFSK